MDIPEAVRSRLEAIENLPTLPQVIEHLGRAMEDPDVSAKRIAKIIEDDPAIMARIMKVVNSTLYSGVQKITSLQSAIVRLGFQTVSNIAMSVAVFSTFPPQAHSEQSFDRAAFWRHCIYTGIAAEVVQNQIPEFEETDYNNTTLQLSGLLHDIGKIIFEQYFHAQFVQVVNVGHQEAFPLHEAETRLLGVNHAQAGAWLGWKWRLPEEIIEVIGHHHHPHDTHGLDHPRLVQICSLANLLVNNGQLGNSGNGAADFSRMIEDSFDLGGASLLKIHQQIKKKSSASFLLMSFI
ncbi:MAG: HDOD domain-containing protein [Desulfohalobiaceae bacterium]|nr:HDOD domain-containing protein [Desulfohalobiaceae bacterium]